MTDPDNQFPTALNSQSQPVPGALIDRILEKWMWNLPDTFSSRVSKDELRAWLSIYFECLKDPGSCADTHQLTMGLLSDFHLRGGQLDDFFFGMLQFLQALHHYEDYDNATVLNELRHLVLADFSSQMVIFYRDALERQNKEISAAATLLRVTTAASSSLDLEKVLQVISRELVQALDARACNSFLFSERSKIGNYYLLDVMPNEYVVPDPPEPFMLEALQSGKPVICYDPALDPRTDKKTVEFFDLRSLLAFPLISKGKPIAAGLLVMNDFHHFTQEEIDLVMTIANAGALAVENARYHETQMQLGIAQERNLLAQELHDRIAQSLAVVKLNLNSALLVMNKPDVIEKVNQSKQLVDDVYQDVRDAILGLRCLPKSVSGSMEEMRDYLATYGAHHAIDIQFLADERDFQVLDCEAVLQVGRIIDEAVVNGCKHASAEHIWVNSGLSENLFWLTIEDDGVGIDWEKLKLMQGDHFGMQIMRERAITAGGHLTITDRPAGGTCVTFEKLVREAN